MHRVGGILRRFISEYGLESGLTLEKIKNHWLKLVGRTIAEHTSPNDIKGKTIFILVDTPQWMHHLSFYKDEIIEKLMSYNINDVRFRLGRLPEETDFRAEKNNILLSEEDSQYIENAVSGLKDDELREKMRLLFTRALTNRKKRFKE